jgi:hypothetical protein
LAQARLLALFDKEFAKRVTSWRIGGASHPLLLNGLFAYLKNPYGAPGAAAASAETPELSFLKLHSRIRRACSATRGSFMGDQT